MKSQWMMLGGARARLTLTGECVLLVAGAAAGVGAGSAACMNGVVEIKSHL